MNLGLLPASARYFGTTAGKAAPEVRSSKRSRTEGLEQNQSFPVRNINGATAETAHWGAKVLRPVDRNPEPAETRLTRPGSALAPLAANANSGKRAPERERAVRDITGVDAIESIPPVGTLHWSRAGSAAQPQTSPHGQLVPEQQAPSAGVFGLRLAELLFVGRIRTSQIHTGQSELEQGGASLRRKAATLKAQTR